MQLSRLPLSNAAGAINATTSYPNLRNTVAIAAVLAMLAACGGGGGNDASTVDSSRSAFSAYAATANSATGTSVLPQLSDAERAEVATLSRHWLATTLIANGQVSSNPNAFAISPLYFARVGAVAAAASGTTLSQIQQAVPTPSSALVQSALINGIARAISAAADAHLKNDFLDAVTANGQPGTWASLALVPLSADVLATEPNLRLSIYDQYDVTAPWPQAQSFLGVFQGDSGPRVQTSLVRIVGQIQVVSDPTADVVALALPQSRWLVRITPTAGVGSWSVDDLERAIENASATIFAQGVPPLVQGELVLPNTNQFTSLSDFRGMDEAQDPVHADLRRLDGLGGDYADFSSSSDFTSSYASLGIDDHGFTISGASSVSFIYSPFNAYNSSSNSFATLTEDNLPVVCAATDLRPSYLVLINRFSGVDMIARFATLTGVQCQ